MQLKKISLVTSKLILVEGVDPSMEFFVRLDPSVFDFTEGVIEFSPDTIDEFHESPDPTADSCHGSHDYQ